MFRFLSLRLPVMILLFAGCQSSPKAPLLAITEAWSRPVRVEMPADSSAHGKHVSGSTGVVYLNIENSGGIADRLLRAHAGVCEVTELHQTIMQEDRMMMQPVSAEGLEVPPRGVLRLAPRGHHIMLIALKHSLNVGDSIEVQLDFAKSGMKTFYFKVRE